MNSDRTGDLRRRTRLGYISLTLEEELYVRKTIDAMSISGFKVGKNVGGKFARLAVLLLCDIYNKRKLTSHTPLKSEEEIRSFMTKLLDRKAI